MKNKFLLLTAIMVSVLFFQCQKNWIETKKVEITEPNFPVEINGWGESFASNLNCAIVEANQNQLLKSANISSFERIANEKFEKFNSGLSKFSQKQLEILGEIAEARNKSKSYIAFSNRLSQINEEIYKTVPIEEQEKLFYITSALYHGLKEINKLVKDGILPGKAEGDDVTLSSIVRLKSANTESDPGSSSWWNDPNSLATVWAIAIAEPTPVGEAVATVLTGIVGSYLVITRADCISEYVYCKTFTSKTNCGDCLHYCIVQGNWNCN
jgi:hypothetical protein